MMTTKDFQILINTLSSITVSGKDNLSCMLGVIQYLQRKMQQCEADKNENEG